MESTEYLDFSLIENTKSEKEGEELNKTEYFEFNAEIKSENIQQKTETVRIYSAKNSLVRRET